MRINHNIQAMNAYRNLSKNQGTISKHMEKLSSGLRINHASDDAAGLAISEKMRTQIRGLQAAERNSMDGISLVQTAEGALDSVHAMLQRMRELAVQASNDTSTEADRSAIQDEINQLTSEINRVGNSIEFNSLKLLDGTISSSNFSNIGRLKGGAEAITGVKANGSLTVGSPSFTINANASVNGTELNGYNFVFGVDSDVITTKSSIKTITDTPMTPTINGATTASIGANTGTLTIVPTGPFADKLNGYTFIFSTDNDAALDVAVDKTLKTVTINADWDSDTVAAPASLDAIKAGINAELTASGLGQITLTSSVGYDATEFGAVVTSPAVSATVAPTPPTINPVNIPIGPTTGDLTITPLGVDLEGYTFEFLADAAATSVVVDTASKTIKIAADWANDDGAVPSLANLQTAITTQLGAQVPPLSGVTLSVSGGYTASEFANKGPTAGVTLTPLPAPNYALSITPAEGDTSLSGVSFVFAHGSSPVTAVRSGNTITVTTDLTDPASIANITAKLNTDYNVAFAFTGSAALLDGETLVIDNNNVKASLSGRTITITADWDNSNGGQPSSLAQITSAINIALRAEGLGSIELSEDGGLPLSPAQIAKLLNAGEISLMGGITAVDAKPGTQVLSVNARPNEKDILVINGKKIGFWDSSQSTYGDAATAKSALVGSDGVILDIYNGMRYKESYEIASEIAALNTTGTFPGVSVIQSEAGSDLIITASAVGKDGNNIRTDYFPTIDAGLNLQIGANTGQKLVVDIPNVRAQSLKITGITSGGEVISADGKTKAHLTTVKTVNNGLNAEMVEYAVDVSTHEYASAAITIFEDALNRVSAARSKIGAFQNRLEYTVSNLAQTAENVTAAESRIRDADMALEMSNFTKNNIISQAAQAMLAQANQLPQGVLQLLK